MNTRLTLLLVILLLLMGLVGTTGCNAGDEATSPPQTQAQQTEAQQTEAQTTQRAQAVRVVTVSSRTMRRTLDYVGTVHAIEQIAVSAQLPGTLRSLAVDQSDRVEAGQLLARIDAADIEARRGQIRAELQRAHNEQDYLCERLATDRKLAEQGVIHHAQLDASRNRCNRSEQAVAVARAKRDELEATLSKSEVRSPVDGYVLERAAESGEQVGPGRPLLVLATDGLEVRVPVVESDLRRGIDLGTPVEVAASPAASFAAEVDEIAPMATGAARSATVTVSLPDGATKLRPGMSVDIRFVLEEAADATPVPLEALVATDEGYVVFLVEGDTATRVPVERGISESGMTAVEPALPDGAKVAVSNLDVLGDGTHVYPVDVPGGTR